jgi:hypothetical protein
VSYEPWDGDDEDFAEVDLYPYNIFMVEKLVEVNTEGVSSSIIVLLGDTEHEVKLGLVFHPQLALQLAANMIEIAVQA